MRVLVRQRSPLLVYPEGSWVVCGWVVCVWVCVVECVSSDNARGFRAWVTMLRRCVLFVCSGVTGGGSCRGGGGGRGGKSWFVWIW